jgi:hypothetical protein
MQIACWITKAGDTNSEYVILTPFPRQLWLGLRPSFLRYTYIACLGNYGIELLVSIKPWNLLVICVTVSFPINKLHTELFLDRYLVNYLGTAADKALKLTQPLMKHTSVQE